MRKSLVPALLALALSALPARAGGCCGSFGFKWNMSGSWCASISPCGPSCCNPCGGYGGGGGGNGPWYGYWPLEAYFNAPALPQYPYWPGPQTQMYMPPAGFGGYAPPAPFG